MSQITKYLVDSAAKLETLTGNSGGPVGGDINGNVNVVGAGLISIAGNAGTNTLTVSATNPVPIANGGTNATSMTNTDGVIYFDGTRLVTSNVGNSGQILTSNGAGMAPSFQTAGTASIDITGDSGGTLSSDAFTFTGGTTGITFSGSGTTETLTGTLVVANGGTGDTSFTVYAPVCGGTSTTGALQSASTGISNSGYVLTSNGSAALPSWQAIPASSITTLAGDSGSATGTTITVSGGSTGLTTAASGSRMNITGTLGIDNGGTDATSYTQNNGVIVYNGTRFVNYNGPQINSSGRFTNSSQPAFQVYQNTSPANVTGDGSTYIAAMNTIVFDQTSSFDTGSFSFVAPVTGRYYLQMAVALTNIILETSVQIYINTSQNLFFLNYVSGKGVEDASGKLQLNGSVFCAMNANDIATFVVVASGSTKTVGILGDSSHTYASGFLVC